VRIFDIDQWQEVFSSLRQHRLRAFLTACGVFWGVFMLLLMLGFGNGLEHGVSKNLTGFATKSVFIWGQQTRKPYQGRAAARRVQLTDADTRALAQLPGIRALAPRVQLGGWQDGNNVSFGSKTGNFGVMGDTPAFARVEGVQLERGRFLNARDLEERRKVAVIGSDVARILYGSQPATAPLASLGPVGQWLEIRGVQFQVVGVAHSERPGEDGERANNMLHVPLSTFQHAFNAHNRVGWFALLVHEGASTTVVEQQALSVLKERHGIDPTDEQALGSYNAGEGFDKVERLFRSLRFFIWFVSVATLCAGALGVSNVLLISVKQRTREIGIKKAIGATPWEIVSAVMQEAVVLTLAAGYLGIVGGVVAVEAAGRALSGLDGPLHTPTVEIGAALIAAGVLLAVGALAGLMPALHAARIRPVLALRAE
jgi:putative ABC transport system permease protein